MKILIVLTALLPVVCFGASVVRTIDAPDTNISGLAWGEDKLWVLDEESSYIYGLDPVSGAVLESFEVVPTAEPGWTPAGLTYQDGLLFSSFAKANFYSYIYFYNTAGSYIGYDAISSGQYLPSLMGLAMVDSTIYMSTTVSNGNWEGCYTMIYVSPGTGFTTQIEYIPDYYETPVGYDIGYQVSTGNIWMAIDNATSPVLCYEENTGAVVDSIPASIGIGSDIRGVAFEGTSSRFLWVSNQAENKLYRIDLQETGIYGNGFADLSTSAAISCAQNPFYSSTVVNLTGFTGNTYVEIFDIQGRTVLSELAGSSLVINGELFPSGTYLIRATDESGCSATSRVIKL